MVPIIVIWLCKKRNGIISSIYKLRSHNQKYVCNEDVKVTMQIPHDDI